MVDYISNVIVAPGIEITRGSKIKSPTISGAILHVKEIIADSGDLEIIAAVDGNEYHLVRHKISECVL